MDRKMRRIRQQLAEEETDRILRTGKTGVLAVAGDDGYPYAVPVNYVYADGSIWFHSAAEGHKINALRRNPKCSFCIVEKDDIVPEEFTTYFRSVIAFCHAEIVDDAETKRRVLLRLSEKYSPGLDPAAEISRFLPPVCIIRLRPDHLTGKQAIELTRPDA